MAFCKERIFMFVKKIGLIILFILTALSLFACGGSEVERGKNDVVIEAKEDVDFLYNVELELYAKSPSMDAAYRVSVNKTEKSVELTVKYNDKDYDYYPEELENLDMQNTRYVAKYNGKVYDVFTEEQKKGKEIIEIDFTRNYEHTEKINLNKEQCENLSDIIAKIQSYDYDKETEEKNKWRQVCFVRPYDEYVSLSVQNNETGEKNEIDCKYRECEYYLIYDESVKELIKKVAELSPVPIVNYWGTPLRLNDTGCIPYPKMSIDEEQAKIAEEKRERALWKEAEDSAEKMSAGMTK